MIVYKITNLLNGKRYIGQTVNSIEKRFKDHSNLNNKCHIGRAIRKYGKENFKIEIVCRADTLKELNEREESLIRLYKTLRPNGYNIALGGSNKGRVISPMKGRKHSEETKKLMSKRAMGKKHSEQTKLRLSKVKKGIKLSSEHIEKLRIVRTGKHNAGNKIIDLNTGKIFKSVTIAAKELGTARRNLVRWLNTNIKQSITNANIKIAYYKEE